MEEKTSDNLIVDVDDDFHHASTLGITGDGTPSHPIKDTKDEYEWDCRKLGTMSALK